MGPTAKTLLSITAPIPLSVDLDGYGAHIFAGARVVEDEAFDIVGVRMYRVDFVLSDAFRVDRVHGTTRPDFNTQFYTSDHALAESVAEAFTAVMAARGSTL